jgi:hypothetical protein
LGNSTKFGAKTRRGAGNGAPDSVWCPSQATRELAALEILWRRSAIIHRTVRCATDISGEPTKQRQMCQRSTALNSKKVNSAQVRSQSSKVRMHRTCPVCHQSVRCSKKTKRLQRSTAPNPNGLLMWQAPDSEQCLVRCTIDSNSWNSGWGYKYPNHLYSSNPSLLHFSFNTRAKGKHSKVTIKAFNPLQAPKSTQLLRDLIEDHLCSFVALVAWIAFSFSFLFF